jgi:hypothetical protein
MYDSIPPNDSFNNNDANKITLRCKKYYNGLIDQGAVIR